LQAGARNGPQEPADEALFKKLTKGNFSRAIAAVGGTTAALPNSRIVSRRRMLPCRTERKVNTKHRHSARRQIGYLQCSKKRFGVCYGSN
jgi:hypothetical protein